MKSLTKHYIDGTFADSHGQEVMELVSPTTGKVIGSVMLGDEEDTRRAIAAAKRAFATFGRTSKEERAAIVRRLHGAASARLDDLTAVMIEEYGGVAQFARLIVQSGVNVFTAAEGMLAFTVGDPADPKTGVGPMVSQRQYQRVQSYIRKGIEEGAEVLVGGEGHPDGLDAGFFAKPTVFVNVQNDMTIAREEIFGPVLCVIAYDSEEEAVRIANDSRYGLHGAVLGTDLQRARRVASQLRTGRVVINGMTDDPQAPWGGFKYSGVGREYGQYGIEAFVEPRAILEVQGELS